MNFKLNETLDENSLYENWSQEDIELFEAIDWSQVENDEYDAGFAYLDSVILYDDDEIQRVQTEFHKFFAKDPIKQPYYMPIELHPFNVNKEYYGPINNGELHKNYKVYNRYNCRSSAVEREK